MARRNTVDITLTSSMQLICAKCNGNLIGKADDDDITVEPCETCIEEAKTDGRNEAEDAANDAAKGGA